MRSFGRRMMVQGELWPVGINMQHVTIRTFPLLVAVFGAWVLSTSTGEKILL